jgi:hypothetical protein
LLIANIAVSETSVTCLSVGILALLHSTLTMVFCRAAQQASADDPHQIPRMTALLHD